jgi:cobalt-zinc-cadmium efflux system membrane fusion protein
MKALWQFAALLGLSLAVSGCREEASAAPLGYDVGASTIALTKETLPIQFESAVVERTPALARPPLSGRVATVDALTSPSFAPLDGYVAEIAVQLGSPVRHGDRLVLVRTPSLATLKHEARAQQLLVKTKESMVARLQKMVDARALSQNDLLVAESELAEARLSAQAARARLSALSVQTSDDTSYWIVANREGVVVSLDVTLGQQVGPSYLAPVAVVADLNEVWVLGDVLPRDAGHLSRGQAVEILLPGSSERLQEGVVETVADVVDFERQTVPVRVRVPNADRALRPNSFVSLRFAASNGAEVVAVPSSAVVSDGARSVVFVEETPGKFVRREVEVGVASRSKVEIRAGLSAGERVVVRGALLLLSALDTDG